MTQTMTQTWPLSDVPAVDDSDLAQAMDILVNNELGLVFLKGISSADRDRLEDQFWQLFEGDRAAGRAVLVRLDELIHVFKDKRLQTLFLETGYALIGRAVRLAARCRLNAEKGFNPHKFLWDLRQQDKVEVNEPDLAAAA